MFPRIEYNKKRKGYEVILESGNKLNGVFITPFDAQRAMSGYTKQIEVKTAEIEAEKEVSEDSGKKMKKKKK